MHALNELSESIVGEVLTIYGEILSDLAISLASL
jgi:hypothetical protein